MNLAISAGLKSGGSVPLTSELKEALEAWKILDDWRGNLSGNMSVICHYSFFLILLCENGVE